MVASPLKTRTGRRRFGALAATVAFALGLAGPAGAQIDPGVNYDPGSPAGKEYAIPLVLGRAEGAGTEDQRAAANTPFGIGITPPGGGRGAGGNGGDTGGGSSGGGAGATGGTGSGSAQAGGAPTLTTEDRTRLARAEEPAGVGTWTIGIWLAVLLPAAAVGFALLDRRSRPAV